jgi:hypothetical protein
MAVDASIFDKPVVNLDFDPEPGGPNQQRQEINHKWVHFKPIAESGGVWLVDDMEQAVAATLSYLRDPAQHRQQRQWIVEFVCQWVDGQSGRRFAEALGELMERRGEGAVSELESSKSMNSVVIGKRSTFNVQPFDQLPSTPLRAGRAGCSTFNGR